jgi:GT2 family glycosyltransferase
VSAAPEASIIIVNTNEKHRLRVALPAVLAGRGSFEVIVSDNGSHDGSLEYIAARHPQVRVVPNGVNLGFGAANNRGSLVARGAIFVFLNPDTSVEPDWLVRLLEPFADPGVGLTTAKILLMRDPQRLNTCGNSVHLSGLTLCRGLGQPRCCFPQREDVGAISGAAFAIRREIFEAFGGFDEDYFIYLDETTLSLQAQLASWRCVYVPDSLVYHDYNLRFGPQKVFLQERNRYLMLLQLYRWPTLLVLLPSLLLAEIVTWGFVLVSDRRNWKSKPRAYAWVLRHWPLVMDKRRRTQARRRVGDRRLLAGTTRQVDFGQISPGAAGKLAGAVFNQLFGLLWIITRGLVWW